MTLFSDATSRRCASASSSVIGAPVASGSAERIAPGTVSAISVAMSGAPTTASISSISAAFGPIWRR